MAADQRSHVFSAAQKTASSPAHKSATNESSLIVMPQAADPNAAASFPNAVASSSRQSSLCRTQAGLSARAPNSVFHGPAAETGTELYPSQYSPCASEGSDHSSSTHSYPRIYDDCCSASSKTSGSCAGPLQIPVIAMQDNELGSMALQAGQISSIKLTQAHEPNKKLHAPASTEESPHKVKKDLEEAAGEVDQGEEEEGCTTPTARDHRIPQYGLEVSALVCPPAPKKKACVSKRRRLFYSANIADAVGAAGRTANNFNSHVVADVERRAFLLDPPDLHNFPDCIRALFK